MSNLPPDREQSPATPGMVILGCCITGVAGLIGAAVGIFDTQDTTGTGVCLLASAVAFGLAANAIFRK